MTAATGARRPVRLHLSESVHGCCPGARAAAHEALDEISVYPDPARGELVEALAAHWHVASEQVAVGNGSDELVLMGATVLGFTDRPGLTTAATFPGYRICLQAVRRGAREVALAGTAIDVAALVDGFDGAGVVFVCNPHNPTGRALARAELDALVAAAASTGVPLVCDEAYMEFAPAGTPQIRDYLDSGAPVLALRTFSKAYGLAGLRIGYALGDAALIAALRSVQGTAPFSVNRVGQAAALAALADQPFLSSVRAANAQLRDWFGAALRSAGLSVLPSVTNFVTVGIADSAGVERTLAESYGILTRDAGRFGLTDHLRMSVASREDLNRVLTALSALHGPPKRPQ